MKKFSDFILIDNSLKKSEPSTIEKAKMLKEKLADANEFMNDKKNDVSKNINYTNKKLKSYDDMKKEKASPQHPGPTSSVPGVEAAHQAKQEAKLKTPEGESERQAYNAKNLATLKGKESTLKCYNDMKNTKKNDSSVSGIKIEDEKGEMGNKTKANDQALKPMIHAENKKMGEPIKKSISNGGISWSQDDLKKGYMAFAGAVDSGMAQPNYNAQPLVKQEVKQSQIDRSPSLANVLDQMDDSKVKV